ncbi:MAG: Rpn family recombination-promoting nuclease/putative transposase [Syntrophomonas sp.]|nr:Rpn family recombination-promoting nuclease/putative transposase [Syntrophomonas sp.]
MPDILDPKVDLVFKKVFGSQENKTILLSFLNAVLNWTGEQQIVDVKILNPYLEPESIDDSVGILDIKLQLENNDLVDVEMQIGNLGNMERRSTYYVCRMFGDQNISNGRYQYLNRVIAINVLDFTRIKHIKRYHSIFRLRETQDNIDLTDAIEIHFIELPKLKLEMASYTNPLDRWVVFLKGGWDMELLDRLAKEDPAIGKAKQVLEQMASNPREKELYELRRKAILDRNSALYEAKMEGIMEGKMEGIMEGKFETARAALLKGADVEFVAEITGLSLDEVQKLKAK